MEHSIFFILITSSLHFHLWWLTFLPLSRRLADPKDCFSQLPILTTYFAATNWYFISLIANLFSPFPVITFPTAFGDIKQSHYYSVIFGITENSWRKVTLSCMGCRLYLEAKPSQKEMKLLEYERLHVIIFRNSFDIQKVIVSSNSKSSSIIMHGKWIDYYILKEKRLFHCESYSITIFQSKSNLI